MASSDADAAAEEERLQCKATAKAEAERVAALGAYEAKHATVHAQALAIVNIKVLFLPVRLPLRPPRRRRSLLVGRPRLCSLADRALLPLRTSYPRLLLAAPPAPPPVSLPLPRSKTTLLDMYWDSHLNPSIPIAHPADDAADERLQWAHVGLRRGSPCPCRS
ncbi:hypothetical protein E2562_003973 [Oryza meyeriana var. granulata]|uniref:Uncharacterized protein n=1 Tax=Oryza meyeriana var. granulata TaxID=110450 RepID=A0A6G1BIJ0_9ORYZ|nr:hypothetical protein E2562_003973 [Oryza meyeriana var. granulata]